MYSPCTVTCIATTWAAYINPNAGDCLLGNVVNCADSIQFTVYKQLHFVQIVLSINYVKIMTD